MIAETAFRELKRKFILALILVIFNLERQIILEIDVSDYAISMYIS
jgi:hypothetical protein